jgi:hypothetical protein
MREEQRGFLVVVVVVGCCVCKEAMNVRRVLYIEHPL